MPARTPAERHFEHYLRGRGLEYEYELETTTGARPDFWVETPERLVVCEVRQLDATLSGRPNRSGAFDATAPITKAIKRKSRQGRGLGGVYPYVVVLWAPHWVDDDAVVIGAVLGRLQISMPFNASTGALDPERRAPTVGRDAALHGGARTHISAVAMMSRFNPGALAAEEEVRAKLDGSATKLERIEMIIRIYGEREAAGLLNDDDREPRLSVFHNPYASVPLAGHVFRGDFDRHYALEGDHYLRVFEGPDAHCLDC